MTEIAEALEKAGFKNVESLCNVYTAILPEKKLRIFVTTNKNEITYSGTFVKTYKKPHDYTKLFETIKEFELSQEEKHKKYTEKIVLKDGTMYVYTDAKNDVKILGKNNGTSIIEVNGQKYFVDHPPEVYLQIIESKENLDEAVKEIQKIMKLL